MSKPRFPLGQENLGKWEGILQSGKSLGILNKLEKSGKLTQYWKSRGISDKHNILFLVIFKSTVYYLLNLIKYSIKQTKHQKNTGRVKEFCHCGKVGTLKSHTKMSCHN